ncbi:hypothetical protein PMG11_02064 [Penicillium brasilianum]|uniref:Uncharacterized protein n=1 Tax=Penicillium brasilianum TaxID=104259 RepID=A0A0F7TLE4_PENBI|nr:hypothetical protein PMG11_02064 [Penicillium brasilianum]
MCQYVGISYVECGHVRFQLHCFCRKMLNQLQRINDPEEREQYDLPFDPDQAQCEPYALFDENGRPVTRHGPGSGNVLSWVFNLSETCHECEVIAADQEQRQNEYLGNEG